MPDFGQVFFQFFESVPIFVRTFPGSCEGFASHLVPMDFLGLFQVFGEDVPRLVSLRLFRLGRF